MPGDSTDVVAGQGVLGREVHFLRKPFSVGELSAGVRAALEQA
ncbi:MAG: hypothetical protein WCJ30_21290 [Deltaproteobacteria bacterium]